MNALRIRYEKNLDPEQCLIIFDEIQGCPDALNSLKYFCEDAPEFHIAAAGSLLGVKLANSCGFPVGKVEFLKLFPMSFLEFPQAIGRQPLHDHLIQINKIAPLEPVIHRDLCKLFKIYCYVGGMPEAVQRYIDDDNLNTVRTVQEAIITAYIYSTCLNFIC